MGIRYLRIFVYWLLMWICLAVMYGCRLVTKPLVDLMFASGHVAVQLKQRQVRARKYMDRKDGD